MSTKERLLKYRKKYNIGKVEIPCSPEESAEFSQMKSEGKSLPPDIVAHPQNGQGYTFTRTVIEEYTDEEVKEQILFKQLEVLEDISKHTGFFYTLAIFGLIISAMALFITFVNCVS